MMSPLNLIKMVTISGFVVIGIMWTASNSLSKPAEPNNTETASAAPASYNPDDFVGSESCKACHEAQFNRFAKTQHARIASQPNWKGKMQGCESCHGPGKAHIEGGGDKSKIHTFENEGAKQISETCLTCHAGREDRNNYRRGEHWRNDIGCTDCHSAHPGEVAENKTGSSTLISAASKVKPDISTLKMLKENQPQLCIKCHAEMKGQFTQPFHHKVLEGVIKCTDCHNAHGGFETKQTRLATGADASCMKCHTDKQGPFVFEHAPLKLEGCTICHTPHGASNPKLLKRNEVRQLCLECHSTAHEIGAPNTPSFHNQATARFQNCTTCHVKIHGSQNHQFFFR